MQKDNIIVCKNSLANAQQFIDNRDKRKAPNNRVGNIHFFDIAIDGARKWKEKTEK